jgi:hypothetical protein
MEKSKLKRRGNVAFAAFCAQFKRSQKQNLWCIFKGVNLCAFSKDDGYGWCIAGAQGKRTFSEGTFDTEQQALRALARRFGVE